MFLVIAIMVAFTFGVLGGMAFGIWFGLVSFPMGVLLGLIGASADERRWRA